MIPIKVLMAPHGKTPQSTEGNGEILKTALEVSLAPLGVQNSL